MGHAVMSTAEESQSREEEEEKKEHPYWHQKMIVTIRTMQ